MFTRVSRFLPALATLRRLVTGRCWAHIGSFYLLPSCLRYPTSTSAHQGESRQLSCALGHHRSRPLRKIRRPTLRNRFLLPTPHSTMPYAGSRGAALSRHILATILIFGVLLRGNRATEVGPVPRRTMKSANSNPKPGNSFSGTRGEAKTTPTAVAPRHAASHAKPGRSYHAASPHRHSKGKFKRPSHTRGRARSFHSARRPPSR